MIENPLRRLRRSHKLTQIALANRVGMTPIALLRYEQGLFEEPSEKLLRYWALRDNDPVALTKAYNDWRKAERERISGKYPAFDVKGTTNSSPFLVWARASGLTVIGLAKVLKVNLAVLQNYLDGTTKRMPADILRALRGIGWNDLDIKVLAENQRAWFIEGRRRAAESQRDKSAGIR